MSNFVHLIGAETVERAARTMQRAADSMIHAAYEIEAANQRQRAFLDEWLEAFKAALEEAKK